MNNTSQDYIKQNVIYGQVESAEKNMHKWVTATLIGGEEKLLKIHGMMATEQFGGNFMYICHTANNPRKEFLLGEHHLYMHENINRGYYFIKAWRINEMHGFDKPNP